MITASVMKELKQLLASLRYVLVFPGTECVVNCQTELPKSRERYNSHLLNNIDLPKVS